MGEEDARVPNSIYSIMDQPFHNLSLNMGQPLWSIQIAEKERAAESQSINNASTERNESAPGADSDSAAREDIWTNVSEAWPSTPAPTLRRHTSIIRAPNDILAGRMASDTGISTSDSVRDFPELTGRSAELYLANQQAIFEARRNLGWGVAPRMNRPLLRMMPRRAQEMETLQAENQNTSSSSGDVADVMPRPGRGILVDMDYATPYILREAGTDEAEEEEEENLRVNIAFDR